MNQRPVDHQPDYGSDHPRADRPRPAGAGFTHVVGRIIFRKRLVISRSRRGAGPVRAELLVGRAICRSSIAASRRAAMPRACRASSSSASASSRGCVSRAAFPSDQMLEGSRRATCRWPASRRSIASNTASRRLRRWARRARMSVCSARCGAS